MYIRNRFMIEIHRFTHSLHIFLARAAHGAIVTEDSEDCWLIRGLRGLLTHHVQPRGLIMDSALLTWIENVFVIYV